MLVHRQPRTLAVPEAVPESCFCLGQERSCILLSEELRALWAEEWRTCSSWQALAGRGNAQLFQFALVSMENGTARAALARPCRRCG